MKTIIRKIISSCTTLSFLLTGYGDLLLPTSFAQSEQVVLPAYGSVETLLIPKNIGKFSIPRNLGTLKDNLTFGTYSSDEKPVSSVIHILDAHCNFAAQIKISEILEYLDRTYGIEVINLEGGAGSYDLSVFTDIEEGAIRDKVTEYFLKQGVLNGAEYFKINNPDKVSLWGIEEKALYLDNLKIYRDSLSYKDEAESILDFLSRTLNRIKVKIYSQELLEMEKWNGAYKTGKMDLKEYLLVLMGEARDARIDTSALPNIHILASIIGEETRIDFRRANTERALLIDELGKKLPVARTRHLTEKITEFSLGRSSEFEFYRYMFNEALFVGIDTQLSYEYLSRYVAYISMYETLNMSKIMDELETFEDMIRTSLFDNDKQRGTARISKALDLMTNMFSFSITINNYRYYRENPDDFNIIRLTSFIKERCEELSLEVGFPEGIESLGDHVNSVAGFFESSFVRDEGFIQNMRYSENAEKLTVIITGGFHLENMRSLFQKEGVNYYSIMPAFKNSDGEENPYFSILAGEKQGFIKEINAAFSAIQVASFWNSLGIDLDRKEADLTWLSVKVFGEMLRTGDGGMMFRLNAPGKKGWVVFSLEKGNPRSIFYEQRPEGMELTTLGEARNANDIAMLLRGEKPLDYADDTEREDEAKTPRLAAGEEEPVLSQDPAGRGLTTQWTRELVGGWLDRLEGTRFRQGPESRERIIRMAAVILEMFRPFYRPIKFINEDHGRLTEEGRRKLILGMKILYLSGSVFALILPAYLLIIGQFGIIFTMPFSMSVSLASAFLAGTIFGHVIFNGYFDPPEERPEDEAHTSRAQRPVVDTSPDEQKEKAWVEAHNTPELRKTADFYRQNITYVDQNEFEKELAVSVKNFKKDIKGRPCGVCSLTLGSTKAKSNGWVHQLAVEKGLDGTYPITQDEESDGKTSDAEYATRWLSNNPEIKDVVFIDDASYSGIQLCTWLGKFLEQVRRSDDLRGREINVHILVPYMSTRAKEGIQKVFDFHADWISQSGTEVAFDKGETKKEKIPHSVKLYDTKKIPIVRELLNVLPVEERASITQTIGNVYGKENLDKTLFYFQHKRPDYASVVTLKSPSDMTVLEGPVVDENGVLVATVPFIPVFPYSKSCYQDGYLGSVEIIRGTEWAHRVMQGEESAGRPEETRRVIIPKVPGREGSFVKKVYFSPDREIVPGPGVNLCIGFEPVNDDIRLVHGYAGLAGGVTVYAVTKDSRSTFGQMTSTGAVVRDIHKFRPVDNIFIDIREPKVDRYIAAAIAFGYIAPENYGLAKAIALFEQSGITEHGYDTALMAAYEVVLSRYMNDYLDKDDPTSKALCVKKLADVINNKAVNTEWVAEELHLRQKLSEISTVNTIRVNDGVSFLDVRKGQFTVGGIESGERFPPSARFDGTRTPLLVEAYSTSVGDRDANGYTISYVPDKKLKDLNRLWGLLNEEERANGGEPGWGGLSDRGGSPIVHGSTLSPDKVLSIVSGYMEVGSNDTESIKGILNRYSLESPAAAAEGLLTETERMGLYSEFNIRSMYQSGLIIRMKRSARMRSFYKRERVFGDIARKLKRNEFKEIADDLGRGKKGVSSKASANDLKDKSMHLAPALEYLAVHLNELYEREGSELEKKLQGTVIDLYLGHTREGRAPKGLDVSDNIFLSKKGRILVNMPALNYAATSGKGAIVALHLRAAVNIAIGYGSNKNVTEGEAKNIKKDLEDFSAEFKEWHTGTYRFNRLLKLLHISIIPAVITYFVTANIIHYDLLAKTLWVGVAIVKTVTTFAGLKRSLNADNTRVPEFLRDWRNGSRYIKLAIIGKQTFMAAAAYSLLIQELDVGIMMFLSGIYLYFSAKELFRAIPGVRGKRTGTVLAKMSPKLLQVLGLTTYFMMLFIPGTGIPNIFRPLGDIMGALTTALFGSFFIESSTELYRTRRRATKEFTAKRFRIEEYLKNRGSNTDPIIRNEARRHEYPVQGSYNIHGNDPEKIYRDISEELARRGMGNVDMDILDKAYQMILEKHTVSRDDGRIYAVHPLEIAHTLVFGLGITDRGAVLAAMLHDIAEDTLDLSGKVELSENIVRGRFVEQLTRSGVLRSMDENPGFIDTVMDLTEKFWLRHEQEGEQERLAVKLEHIERVEQSPNRYSVLLRVVDRIHNLRTNESVPEEKQSRMASAEIDRWFTFLGTRKDDIPEKLLEEVKDLLNRERDKVVKEATSTSGKLDGETDLGFEEEVLTDEERRLLKLFPEVARVSRLERYPPGLVVSTDTHEGYEINPYEAALEFLESIEFRRQDPRYRLRVIRSLNAIRIFSEDQTYLVLKRLKRYLPAVSADERIEILENFAEISGYTSPDMALYLAGAPFEISESGRRAGNDDASALSSSRDLLDAARYASQKGRDIRLETDPIIQKNEVKTFFSQKAYSDPRTPGWRKLAMLMVFAHEIGNENVLDLLVKDTKLDKNARIYGFLSYCAVIARRGTFFTDGEAFRDTVMRFHPDAINYFREFAKDPEIKNNINSMEPEFVKNFRHKFVTTMAFLVPVLDSGVFERQTMDFIANIGRIIFRSSELYHTYQAEPVNLLYGTDRHDSPSSYLGVMSHEAGHLVQYYGYRMADVTGQPTTFFGSEGVQYSALTEFHSDWRGAYALAKASDSATQFQQWYEEYTSEKTFYWRGEYDARDYLGHTIARTFLHSLFNTAPREAGITRQEILEKGYPIIERLLYGGEFKNVRTDSFESFIKIFVERMAEEGLVIDLSHKEKDKGHAPVAISVVRSGTGSHKVFLETRIQDLFDNPSFENLRILKDISLGDDEGAARQAIYALAVLAGSKYLDNSYNKFMEIIFQGIGESKPSRFEEKDARALGVFMKTPDLSPDGRLRVSKSLYFMSVTRSDITKVLLPDMEDTLMRSDQGESGIIFMIAEHGPQYISDSTVKSLEAAAMRRGGMSSVMSSIRKKRPELIRSGTLADLISQPSSPVPKQQRPLFCWRVYLNDNFIERTEGLSTAVKYGIALESYELMVRHGRDPEMNDNITAAVRLVMDERADNPAMSRRPFDGNTHIINMLHDEEKFDPAEMARVEGRPSEFPYYKGVKSMDDALRAISNSGSLPLTVFFNGHGGKRHLGFEQFDSENANVEELYHDKAINYVQLGKSLTARGNLDKVTIILSCCYSHDYRNNLISYLLENGVKAEDLPVIISSAYENEVSFNDTFMSALERITENGTVSPQIRSFFAMADSQIYEQMMTIYFPYSKEGLSNFLESTPHFDAFRLDELKRETGFIPSLIGKVINKSGEVVTEFGVQDESGSSEVVFSYQYDKDPGEKGRREVIIAKSRDKSAGVLPRSGLEKMFSNFADRDIHPYLSDAERQELARWGKELEGYKVVVLEDKTGPLGERIMGAIDPASKTIYLAQSIAFKPLSLIHEFGEGLLNTQGMTEDITRHTAMRGAGKDVRAAYAAIHQNIPKDASPEKVIELLDEKMKAPEFAISSARNKASPITESEKAHIAYTISQKDKSGYAESFKRFGMEAALFGMQDRIDPFINRAFSESLAETKAEKRAGVASDMTVEGETVGEISAQRPIVDLRVDDVKAREWIDAHPEGDERNLARFLIDRIKDGYVNHGKFEDALRMTVAKFKGTCRNDYCAVLIGADGEEPGEMKSNGWAYRIARGMGMSEPKGIISAPGKGASADHLANHLETWLVENPEINDVMFIDDASYSGKQLTDWLNFSLMNIVQNASLTGREIRVHMNIPFITKKAKDEAEKIAAHYRDEFGCKTVLIWNDVEEISTVDTIIEKHGDAGAKKYGFRDARHLLDVLESIYGIQRGYKTLMYFQHKLPDFYSVLYGLPTQGTILEGPVVTLDGTGQRVLLSKIPFIPIVEKAPYDEGYLEWVEKNIAGSNWEGRINRTAAKEGDTGEAALKKESEKVHPYSEGIGALTTEIVRDCQNIIIARTSFFQASNQENWARKAARKFTRMGVDTLFMGYQQGAGEETTSLISSIKSALERARKDRDKNTLIYVHYLMEKDPDVYRDLMKFIESLPESEQKLIVLQKDESALSANVRIDDFNVDILKVVSFGTMMLNDTRIRSNVGPDNPAVVELRRLLVDFIKRSGLLSDDSSLPDGSMMDADALEIFMNDLKNGRVILRLTPVNYNEIQEYNDSMLQVYRSL